MKDPVPILGLAEAAWDDMLSAKLFTEGFGLAQNFVFMFIRNNLPP